MAVKTPILATAVPITWERVKKSSTIEAISYHGPTKTMHVMFKGARAVYELTPVPPHRHNAFRLAESKGQYYHEQFKMQASRYTIKRIDPGVPSLSNQRDVVKDRKSGNDVVGSKFVDKVMDIMSRKPAKSTVVGTPLYLALLKTRKLCKQSPGSLPYLLWSACGKEARTGNGGTRYRRALALIAEASGDNTIGAEYLDAAIKLAAERKL